MTTHDTTPTAGTLSCPRCGHDQICFDYLAMVSVAVRAGAAVSVVSAGVLDGLPEAIYCSACGDDQHVDAKDERTAELLVALDAVLERDLPAATVESLSSGVTVWEALSPPPPV